MDGQIEMPFKPELCDEDMVYFQELASPAKSDASSVDIYDGLDMVTSTERAAEKSSPSRNCLDLYEEILTEEGTAKEASLNDLQGEYEKCQNQMKQLITKLKEMKSMNSSLQNENQSLKKNISALIKTARVEITRKEDEINRLNQRLGAPWKNQTFKPNPLPSFSMSKSKSNNPDLAKNLYTESISKTNIDLQSKDITSGYSRNRFDKEKTCIESSQTITSINPNAKRCKGSTVNRSQEPTFEPLCLELNDNKRKEKDIDSQNKVPDRNRTKERPKSSLASSEGEKSDLKEKACQPLLKCCIKESSQENINSKPEVGSETIKLKCHSSSTKEKIKLKELDYSKQKEVKKYERSPHRRESRAHEKEKNTESRHRTPEKNEEPRRSKRTLKDDAFQVLELSDAKQSNAGRKDKHSSEYSESKHGNKDSKQSKSENSTRYKANREQKTERSERDRRGDEKKRSRDEQDRSRHDRKDKGHQTKEKDMHRSSNKDKDLHSKISETSKNREKAKKVDNIQKDLKLSFMETLHLTLSPAKKSSAITEQVVSSMETEVEGNMTKGFSQLSVIENSAGPIPPQKTDLRHSELTSKDCVTTKASNIEDSKLVSQCEPNVDTIICLNDQPQKLSTDENSELLTTLTVEDESVVCTVEDTVNSEEMDTHSLVNGSDLIDLDSFIEIDRCSASPTSENSNVSVPDEQIQDDGIILERSGGEENQAINMKSNLTETSKGISESPDTDIVDVCTKGIENKQCFDDECSMDLKFLRPIPKILSPLKSPVRPKANLYTLERTAKASAVSILYKELSPDTDNKSPCLSISEELNKENCQPDNMSDLGCKIPEVVSADELEEGEILSEDEQICKKTALSISEPCHLVPDQVTSVTTSPSCQESELQPLSKPDLLILPPEKAAAKNKVKIDTCPKLSAFPTSKRKMPSADSCLDGILKIVTPLSIQDVLQMLRIIRIHIRKKYMKFKIQVSLCQFHRLIEAATLCFITLVRSLDWSCLCSSPEKLQKKLCKHIETRLKKLKKNGIVDRIFEQHLIDMKKRLWKFVEEQLDSLFDTLKAMILVVCDKADADKHLASSINTQKSYPVENSQNERSGHLDKVGSVPCLRRLEFCSQARSDPSTDDDSDSTVQKEIVEALPGISLNSETVIPSRNVSSTLKYPHLSSVKSSIANEPNSKSQPNCSGLSFNLVSDDHMGDIFKSLIHSSDNLPPNTLPESMWLLGTPEKHVPSQKCDNVDSLSEKKPPSAFSWSSLSPPHLQTFPRHETVLSPDVFDENCLLEVPTSASPSKTLNSSEDWLKSSSSVLMEDLAVSLTVPSPLKSDSHLSFLRPVCNSESISEVDVKCCEGSVLDEDDASEQDLHLTLDSDNSSIGSLEDTGEAGSFQYHPSEPMQAVIMERSNDHFIVKIRRAVSSSSPVSDCSSEETNNVATKSLNTGESCDLELKTTLETNSEAPNNSVLPHPKHSDLANVTENSVIDIKRSERDPLTVQENESVFKLPSSTSQDLEIPAEIKLTTAGIVKGSTIECESNVTICIEETCSPVLSSDTLPMKTSKAVDLNLRKRKSVDEEPSAKRQKRSPPNKDKGTKQNKMKPLDLEKSNIKRPRRAISDGSVYSHASKVSPTSLSAKNVIKKKGEVVVSWTRDEDRTILLECQKLGPTKKTFLYLSSTMNKFPHQVEERFRQLMKLFKKSRNSSS